MKRPLVVDDEPAILELLETFLRDEGYEVLTAIDGNAALEAMAAADVDLLVTDTMMPRRSGVDLVRSMREHPEWDHIPVIVISVARRSHWGDLSVTAFLDKPFDLNTLLELVADALRTSPARDGA